MSHCKGCSNKVRVTSKRCPLCHEASDYLSYRVVEMVVKEELKRLVVNNKYYTCKNKDCDLVFFSEEEETMYLIQDINISADFDAVTKSNLAMGNCSGCGKSNCK